MISTCVTLSNRVYKIKKFFEQICPHSPLIGYEEIIVKTADKYNLDYRLYVAIAGCESTYGLRYPKWSNNLTGYGIYGNKVYGFPAILDNIEGTYKLIAFHPVYGRYQKSKKIADLVYVYKGVPPYKRYIVNMLWIMNKIEKGK